MMGILGSLWEFMGQKDFQIWGKVYSERFSMSYINLYKVPDRYQWPRTGYGDYVLGKYHFEFGMSMKPVDALSFSASLSHTPFALGQSDWNSYYGSTNLGVSFTYSMFPYLDIQGGYSYTNSVYDYQNILPPWELDPQYWELLNNVLNDNRQVDVSFWFGFVFKPGK